VEFNQNSIQMHSLERESVYSYSKEREKILE